METMASKSPEDVTWTGRGLDTNECERYARQLCLPKFGINSQKKLKDAAVLVVGCGGLGSPVCLYLAAAGVGTLGVVDHDEVDKSNLHRQILHQESKVGVHKALSAADAIAKINSGTKVETHLDGFRPASALDLVAKYDVVVDASDNPATRYCINDACVIAGRPLVSGAAIGTDGQLSVYNHGKESPCYRCIWPDPPESGTCQRCSDAGVLGVLPGIIGTLQALEAIKVITGVGDCSTNKLLMFDGMSTSFRSLKLRPRQDKCIVCGSKPQITAANLAKYDYERNCGGPMHDKDGLCLKVLPDSNRLSCKALKGRLSERKANPKGEEPPKNSSSSSSGIRPKPSFLLIDVRPRAEYDFASLSGSISLPMREIEDRLESCLEPNKNSDGSEQERMAYRCLLEGMVDYTDALEPSSVITGKEREKVELPDLCVVCRRGNDSQLAVEKFLKAGISKSKAFDLVGGLQQWSKEVDPSFPIY